MVMTRLAQFPYVFTKGKGHLYTESLVKTIFIRSIYSFSIVVPVLSTRTTIISVLAIFILVSVLELELELELYFSQN